MKRRFSFNPLDIFVTSIIVLFFLWLSYQILTLLQQYIILLAIEYRGIVNILLFITIFWFMLCIIYPFLLRNIYNLKKGEFDFNEKSLNRFIWGQLSFCYMFSADTFNYIIPTPLRKFFYILIGAKIANKTFISGKLVDPWFISIGSNCFIGENALLTSHIIISEKTNEGKVLIKKIKIGNNVTIGAHSIIMPGVEIGNNSRIKTGSLVESSIKIPENEVWGGNPAKKITTLRYDKTNQTHKNLNDIKNHLKKVNTTQIHYNSNNILKYIKNEINNNDITINSKLLDNGFINSLQFLDLLDKLQKKFKIKIDMQKNNIYKLQNIEILLKSIEK